MIPPPYPLAATVIAVLREVFVERRPADRALEGVFKAHPRWEWPQRAFVAEETYAHIRWWRWHWHLAGLPDKGCLDPAFLTEARLWAAWTAGHVWRTGQVPAIRECGSPDVAALRRRAEEDVPAALRASVPDWLYQRGQHDLGDRWPALLDALNQPAELFLRANTLRVSAADLAAQLKDEGFAAVTLGDQGLPEALRLSDRKDVFSTRAFRDGLFEVQDAASQRVAPFLDVAPGQRVIDACAGAGGKALHIATLMRNKGNVIALDPHPRKLEELRRRARRAGLHNIQAKQIEDSATVKRLHGSADRVLLDVPCSGLGVLRRNPETKWRLVPADLDRLAGVQADILARYSRLAKTGGKLVYATCSILPGENRNQIDSFLALPASAWTLEAELDLPPGPAGHDGFYAARLVRG